MENFETDIVVIGAGVVGLAIAQRLARDGREVIVLEAGDAFGTQTSSRNSEVIHAGLYYRTDSLKAKLCVDGRRKLYEHIDRHGITVSRCGKLVVAVDDAELPRLEALKQQSDANDVEGVSVFTARQAHDMEPALTPGLKAAIWSETSGIFDSHGYMASLVGLLEDAGGQIAYLTSAAEGRILPEGGVEIVTSGEVASKITAQLVINAAGHGAIPLASRIEGPHAQNLPVNRFVKGSYFTVLGKTPFSRLIYPMHSEASLGLHLTVDLAGQGKLGPDAEWLPEEAKPPFDYQVDPARAELFYATVRRYWPGLRDGMLSAGYSGVRPKIVSEGQPSGDFRIEGPATHGSSGLVNLFGIESPGLTASLAIADHVFDLVQNET